MYRSFGFPGAEDLGNMSRIMIVSIDEPSLKANPAPLTEWGQDVGEAISGLFKQNAAGVSVDLLLPIQWSSSDGFVEAAVTHSNRITLSALSTEEQNVIGADATKGLITVAPWENKVSRMFGYVNVNPDPDGVVRTFRQSVMDKSGAFHDTFVGRTAQLLVPQLAPDPRWHWIDCRIDDQGYSRISWKDLSGALRSNSNLFKDKIVLIGAEYEGTGDIARISSPPGHPRIVSGLVLNAMMIDTILEGLPFRVPATRLFYVVSLFLLIPAIAMAALYRSSLRLAILLSASLCVAYLAVGLAAFFSGYIVPSCVPSLFCLLSLSGAVLFRRRLPARPSRRH